MFQLFDTMTRRKIPLPQHDPDLVTLYVCGPTVYNYIHIGNARPAVVFDTLVRHWRASGLRVRFARNFTDVDDRIIGIAIAEKSTPQAVADRYIAAYQEDTAALGCAAPTFEPRVSDYIPQIVGMIEMLVARGHAYVLDGDVYFDVATFSDYGKLSRRPVDEWSQESRVAHEAGKRHKADFALWKKAKSHEPSGARWPSPWGDGRPGWHIECSAIVKELFGDTVDVHAGGIDLCFPHHDNEIAQSECATGATLARAWIHNAFVNFDGDKVSKTRLASMSSDLSALFMLRYVRQQFEGEAIRFWLLSQHYRTPMEHTVEFCEDERGTLVSVRFPSLLEAERRLEYVYETRYRLLTRVGNRPPVAAAEPRYAATSSPAVRAFQDALDDDLNTPAAIAVLWDLLTRINELCDQKRPAQSQLRELGDECEQLCAVFAIGLDEPAAFFEAVRRRRVIARNLDEVAVRNQIEARSAARASRDYSRADEIRGGLKAIGVELRDEPDGSTTWRVLPG